MGWAFCGSAESSESCRSLCGTSGAAGEEAASWRVMYCHTAGGTLALRAFRLDLSGARLPWGQLMLWVGPEGPKPLPCLFLKALHADEESILITRRFQS